MSLYPSLEDMKVDQMAQAQRQYDSAATHAVQWPAQAGGAPPAYPPQGQAYPQQAQAYPPQGAPGGSSLYPSLSEYMGLQITPEMMAIVPQQTQVAVHPAASGQMQVVAPVTGDNKGLQRAEIKQGIREVLLCKDQNGRLGLRVRHVNNGLFVALVDKNSAAALAGLRFGDQILQINGQTVAGWDNDKAHKFIKNAAPQKITMAVRDRPFERTITLQKDSQGFIGFLFKKGKVTNLVKDSSAARNGMLTDHYLIEINGQNTVGLKDDDIAEIINAGGRTVTVTVMPGFVYDHIVKCMGNSLVKKNMDHSIPDW